MGRQQRSMGESARSAIRPTKERSERDLLNLPGVTGVDIAEKETDGQGTGALSIVVFVESKRPVTDISKSELIPKEIDGIPTDVQVAVFEVQSSMERIEDDEVLIDKSSYETLVGGISMSPRRSFFLAPPFVEEGKEGNYINAGTLGALAIDRSTGKPMALTNFHVACINDAWRAGDRMIQPGRRDDGDSSDTFGDLVRGVLNEHVDAAVVRLDEDSEYDPSVVEVGDVAGIRAAEVGMTVQKRGRTTEHTFGTVVSTDFTVNVRGYNVEPTTRTFTHQIRIKADDDRSETFSDSGDSGSVIMDTDRYVVGLLFAGGGQWTSANPIHIVQNELDIDIMVRKVWRIAPTTLGADCIPRLVTTLETSCNPLVVTTLKTGCIPWVVTTLETGCIPKVVTTLKTGCLPPIDWVTRLTCPSNIVCQSRIDGCPSSLACPPWKDRDGNPLPMPFSGQEHALHEDASAGVDPESYWAGYLSALEHVESMAADDEQSGPPKRRRY